MKKYCMTVGSSVMVGEIPCKVLSIVQENGLTYYEVAPTNFETFSRFVTIDFIKPLITFEEVLNAWRNVEPSFRYRDEAVDKDGIRFIFPNGIIYEINTEQVYSNKKVFSMNVEQSLKAINLTVQYLKERQS